MRTIITKPTEKHFSILPKINPLRVNRFLSSEKWIELHASGTLRKNKKIGFSWKNQYLNERIAYEFGWEFEILPASRVTFNDPFSEEDSKSITEAGWHCERYIIRNPFPEDVFECKYIIIEYPNEKRREGIGLICKQTSAKFVKNGFLVFAIISEFNKEHNSYKRARNPF